MRSEEIIDIVQKINSKNTSPVDEDILKRVLLLVIEHPLEGDRGICQEDMRKMIIDKVG